MLDEGREVSEGAHRDGVVSLVLRTVGVARRNVRDNNLHVALGAEGARLQQRLAVKHAPDGGARNENATALIK